MNSIKMLDVPRIASTPLDMVAVERLLANNVQHAIAEVNWPTFDYSPRVTFAIGYGGGDLCLRFAVEEKAVLAEKTATNDPVCQDSCVEMFIAPQNETYFNFEFNCIGTALAGQGHGREDLERLEPAVIAGIRRLVSLGNVPFSERRGPVAWTLAVAIPLTILGLSEETLPGHSCRANFYKCGDHLSTPHYLTWNPVNSSRPDFHRPECFGVLRFV